jgi:RND family efflux transporter MFP subunit
MKKLNLFSSVLIASAVVVACTSRQEVAETETPISVKVGIPMLVTGDKISVSGQIESGNTAIVSTRVMGFISSIHVNPGERVDKGQLLVVISNSDIQAKRAQAVAMISEAEAALHDAEKDFNRFEKLHKQGSASEKEYENALLRYNAVKAKTEASHQVKLEADAMLEYTNLTAPFSGVITQKFVDAGSMANPGMPILAIEQPSDLEIRAMVSENEVGRIRNQMEAEVTVKSTGRKFQARISELSPSSQFTGGRFQIKLKVPSQENTALYSGMYVNVSILAENDAGQRSLFVPASVIIYKNQLAGLYTVDSEQKAQLRWLKVGKIESNRVEVLSGLRPDEKFISQSDGRLYSGASVSVSNNEIIAVE